MTAVLAVVVAAGALAACGSSRAGTGTSAVEKPDLTVAAVPASGAAGLYIAQQDGFFTAAGLHVKIVPVASGGDVLASLVNGSIDVDEGQWTSAIAAQAAGIAKLHALAAGNAGGPGVQEITVLPGSGITTVKQLAGKTIAVNALAGLTVLLTSTMLAASGIHPTQVHYVVIPFPAMAAALAARRVDAAFLIEPYLTQAETSTGAEPLFDLDQGPTEGLPAHRLRRHADVDEPVSEDGRRVHGRPAQGPGNRRGQPARRGKGPRRLHHDQQADRRDHGHRHLPAVGQRGGAGPGRDLMREQHALPSSVNVTELAREMTSR